MINRCIPAVFNKILDLKEQLKTADNNSIQTVFGETVTGTKLENGTMYEEIIRLSLVSSHTSLSLFSKLLGVNPKHYPVSKDYVKYVSPKVIFRFNALSGVN